MYILIVLMISQVKSSGTATLSFIFPNSQEKEMIEEIADVREPVVKLEGVKEENGNLAIDLSSRESLELSVVVCYGKDEVKSLSGVCIDGVQKIEVPIVLSGQGEKVRWVNILWENDGLMVCNASNEDLPDMSGVSNEQFAKN
jgi:hypothetical protein